MLILNDAQKNLFHQDGLILVDRMIDDDMVNRLRDAFDRIFEGEFETGTLPDEVNWQLGKSDPELTRQICNAWKANRSIARVILCAEIGKMVAELMDWPGTRVMQDNAIWKPAGAKSIGYHQDNAYLGWFEPGEICTVWIALDDVEADNGTMELVRGSHRWQHAQPEGDFHAPEDYRAPMVKFADIEGVKPDIVPVAVPRGSGSIHHGWTWHGSGANTGSSPRRSLVLHAMSSSTEFVRDNFHQGTGPIYSRYARLDSSEMDENYFPIIWRRDGYSSSGIARFLQQRFPR
jgi:ectoine hydroxylase-related dioxygenase (phytanoyl-CoA dioxygenase family)